MAFRVKNITQLIQTIFGTPVLAYDVLDLLTITTEANIKASIISGELYSKLMGRGFALAVPQSDYNQIGLTVEELNFIYRAGFLQGNANMDDLKYPFKFNADGYLSISVPGTSTAVDPVADGYLSSILTTQTSGLQKSIVRGGVKGTTVAADITGRATGTNSQALDVYNVAPSCVPGNYSTARGDASAIRASDVTVTFTGPTIISSQIRRVIAFISASVQPLIWEQGVNAALSYSAGTITVYAIDGNAAPIPATTTLVVVDWVAQDKGYDQSLQAIRTAPQYSDRSYRQTDPVSIIAAAQNLTNAWADCGNEILVDGSNTLCWWINLDINNSLNVRFRVLAKHTSQGAVEYMLPTKVVDTSATPYLVKFEGNQLEYNNAGVDAAFVLSFALDNCVRYCQPQIMAVTVGVTPGQILNSEITQAY